MFISSNEQMVVLVWFWCGACGKVVQWGWEEEDRGLLQLFFVSVLVSPLESNCLTF